MNTTQTTELLQAFDEYLKQKELEVERIKAQRQIYFPLEDSSYIETPILGFQHRMKEFDENENRMMKRSMNKRKRVLVYMIVVILLLITGIVLI